MPWQSDDELYQLARRELFTAVVGDVMDKLGLQSQFLDPRIGPLRDDMVVIGRAMTVLEADVFGENVEKSANPLMQKSFGLMLEALDDLKAGEVYICTGSSPRDGSRPRRTTMPGPRARTPVRPCSYVWIAVTLSPPLWRPSPTSSAVDGLPSARDYNP